MSYEDQLKEMATAELDAFDAVDVVYKPLPGGTRSIRALIDYEMASEMGRELKGRGFKAILSVVNDVTDGISSVEFDGGGDKIAMPWPRIGDDAQDRMLKRIVDQDAGMIMIGVN